MVEGTFWEIFPKKLQHFEEEKCFEIIKIFGRFLTFSFLLFS
jgi:hypothetical protein